MANVFVAVIMALQLGAAAFYFRAGNWRLGVVWLAYVAINAAITPWGRG